MQTIGESMTTRLAMAEARIGNLERRSRRRAMWTITTSVSLLAAAGYMGSGAFRALSATNERTVQAPFKVLDDNGKTLLLVQNKDGQNQLQLFGLSGKLAVAAFTDGDHGMLIVGDGNGKNAGAKAGLMVDKNGSGALELRDAESQPIADIEKGPKSQGLIVYRSGTSQPAIEVFGNETTAKIGIRDSNNYFSGMFGSAGGTELELSDASSKDYVSIKPGGTASASPGEEPQPDGTKGIALYNKDTQAAFIGLDRKGSGKIDVWDDGGDVAQLGISMQGFGGQLLLGSDSKLKAWLQAKGPAGIFFAGPNGTSAAELSVATYGGRLWLGSNDGVGMIEGGVTDSNRGVMRAGPETGGPVGLTGLPTAILGHK